MNRIAVTSFLVFFFGVVFVGCSPSDAPNEPGKTQTKTTDDKSDSNDSRVLRLASTTSTRDSGLLDVLLPVFEKQHNCRVDLVAVGTGAALKLGETGDVDALVCHARAAETAFMKAKHGIRHEEFMHNYFLIVGPANDPAKILNVEAVEALKLIASSQQPFISRGDESGTHKRERSLWKKANIATNWGDYLESGQGMGPTLMIADEKNAYTLTDEGTWWKRYPKLRLAPLVTAADELKNPYAVLVVNPQKHNSVNQKLADAFAEFLISETAQRLIGEFQVNGKQLFYPQRKSRSEAT
jgi:tungstate transport system substrate-binding protein